MKILIAAGGTGGHLFPAIRLAEEIGLRRLGKILFVTSPRKQDRSILEQKNITFAILPAIPLQSRGILAILNFTLRLIAATLKSLFLLVWFRPDAVIGFGGYVSGPIVLLASLSGAKTIVHEQNVYPGKANRILARFVNKIAITFPETRGYLKGFESKIVISGNPLRREFKRGGKTGDAFTPLEKVHPVTECSSLMGFSILAMGGSQGAHALNKLIPEAVGLINGDRKKVIEVIHISGAKDRDEVSKAYSDRGVKSRVFSFTEEIAGLYNESDFVIARSGATTVSELLFLAKPSILIPYPHAGGHQRLNAKVLEDKGIALLIEEEGLTPESLRDAMMKFMDKNALAIMSEKIKDPGALDACDVLIKEAVGG